MSFGCTKHGWSHLWNHCPMCPTTTITGNTDSASFTINPENIKREQIRAIVDNLLLNLAELRKLI